MSAGGAVAFADTDSESASSPTEGATPTGQQSTGHRGPVARLSESLRTTLREVTTTAGMGRKPPTQSLAGITDSVTKSALDAVSSGIAATTVVTRTVTGVIEPAQPPLTPTNDSATLNPVDVAPTAVAAVPDVSPVSPVIDAVVSTVDQVASAPASVSTTALTTVQSVVAPVMSGVASIPNLTAPIPDVITALQSLLTATTDAVTQFSTLPSDLASLFGVTGTAPTSGIVGTGGPLAASGSPVMSPLQLIQLLTDSTAVVPVPMATLPIDVTAALGLASAASTSARVAPSDVVPGGLAAFFQSAGGVIAIVAVSLSALALAAVSGVAGMLASTAAGVRIGYRQAKARMALRASGIARFAVGGPVGVVRSGTLVKFRPRTAKVVRPGARSLSRNVA